MLHLFINNRLSILLHRTPEPLGDILKVQVWHDNSGGSESGWFVCETSVADLVLGAIYIYPCYRWLSVQAEDAKVEREITLESPTTFLQVRFNIILYITTVKGNNRSSAVAQKETMVIIQAPPHTLFNTHC